MTPEKIVEYRGVHGLVAAEVLSDTSAGITFGTPFAIAGTAEVQKAVNSSVAAHYYDNVPAVVVQGKGADVRTIQTSAIPLDALAQITGQYYDSNTGMLVEGNYTTKYFALGYITGVIGDAEDAEYFVWTFKGVFSAPDQTNPTKNDGTDANGQTLTYTSVNTIYKFNKTGKNASGIVLDTSLGAVIDAGGGVNLTIDENSFFGAVRTPDDIVQATTRTLNVTPGYNTTITIYKNGTKLGDYVGTSGQPVIYHESVRDGDQLTISVTGGTVLVNSDEWFSGDIHIVTGNVTVTSAASA